MNGDSVFTLGEMFNIGINASEAAGALMMIPQECRELRLLRRRLGHSQRTAAEICGVDKSFYAKAEQGVSVDASARARAFAAALKRYGREDFAEVSVPLMTEKPKMDLIAGKKYKLRTVTQGKFNQSSTRILQFVGYAEGANGVKFHMFRVPAKRCMESFTYWQLMDCEVKRA